MNEENQILHYLRLHPLSSRREIMQGITLHLSPATGKRLLAEAVARGAIETVGKGPATRYRLAPASLVTLPLSIDTYFQQEIDERQGQTSFNFALIRDILPTISIFTPDEHAHLVALQHEFQTRVSGMAERDYRQEMSRLGIDLSWKSSQIEGNTYTLLETERLLNDLQPAPGKSREEAIMLLNHKNALNFILDHPDVVLPLTVRAIEDIHALLVRDLDVDTHLRRHRVGITGTNYRPLDNEFQLRDALDDTCALINAKQDVFEQALLLLLLLSYIQPFADGNKRTARLTANALLVAHAHCPISFRTVDPLDYKKALLLFYEQNNLFAFKQIFINQFEFAVHTYF